MTQAQAQMVVAQHGGKYVTSKGGIVWYRLPDGSWLAWRVMPNGTVDLRKLPAGSCGCG